LSLLLGFLLAQATSYPGGDFMYAAGRCSNMGPPTGPVHWGLERSECAELSKLDAQLNHTYQTKMKSLSAKGRIALRNSERAWLAKMNDTCGLGNDATIVDEATADCFATEVRKRIAELSAPAAKVEPATLDNLLGEWRIWKAELVHPEGVQAYSTDQLQALVGNRLIISRNGASWLVSNGRAILREHTWLSDQCSKPAIEPRTQKSFDLRCGDGSVFGHEGGSFSKLGTRELKLDWWDGVALYLRKAK
jgi:hypothetical protein